MALGVGDDDAMMMLVDRNASRVPALELRCTLAFDIRQERVIFQQYHLQAILVRDQDTAMLVVDRQRSWSMQDSLYVTSTTNLRDKRSILRREHLYSMVATIRHIQEVSLGIERHVRREDQQAIRSAWLLESYR